jgi:hypothetical protein
MLPPLTIIFLWPLVVLLLFKRCNLPAALCWSIIAGYLLLPSGVTFNLPLLPSVTKDTMPSMAAAFMLLFAVGRERSAGVPKKTGHPQPILPGWIPRSSVGFFLSIALVAGAFVTSFFNDDRLIYGIRIIPGLSTYDGFSAILSTLTTMLPMLLARKYLATPENHKTLLFILCIAGLIYSLPTLYEVRMSPQLNRIVYGYFPHSWGQHLRGEGYRPLVFLHHGLWLGIFLSTTVLSTIACIRIAAPKHKALFWGIAVWLAVTLLLSKTLGALLITLAIAPAVLLFSVRLQLILVAAVAATVLLYPTLRGAGLIPVDQVVSFAEKIDPSRARSLNFRLKNEDILLEKANQRPLFGWGGWGRARVYDEEGADISVTDGRWVISIGNEGWFGYLARFGLLTIPILLLSFRKRKYEVTLATSALCLVLAGNLIDLIPNAGLTPVTWLMAGALLGRLEVTSQTQVGSSAPEPEPLDRAPRYSRAKPVQGHRHRPSAIPAKDKPGYTRYARANSNREPSKI